jgi:ComF family protein
LPPRCLGCHSLIQSHSSLCLSCWNQLTFITSPQCLLCGFPFELEMQKQTLCGDCIKQKPKFKQARASLIYTDSSKKLILPYKHGDALHFTPLFTNWLFHTGKDFFPEIDIIVPVPLHWTRLIKRRYNQAALLSLALSKKTKLSHLPTLLKRRKMTKSQGQLSSLQRLRNVQNAFTVPSKYLQRLNQQHVLLIDDVYTSGATINACTYTLLKNGAKTVSVLTVARVIKN